MYIEGLDSYIISSFVSSLNEFMKNSEDLTVTKNLDNEFSKMKDIVEQHKKKLVQAEHEKQKANEIRQKIDLAKHTDVITDAHPKIDSLRLGNILDALDDYGQWHLSVVIEEQPGSRKMHFMPFNNAKRDEVFTDENKIAPAFTNTELPSEPEKALATLRDYFSQLKIEVKPSAQVPVQSMEEAKGKKGGAGKPAYQRKPTNQKDEEEKSDQMFGGSASMSMFGGANPFGQIQCVVPQPETKQPAVNSSYLEKHKWMMSMLEVSYRHIPRPHD